MLIFGTKSKSGATWKVATFVSKMAFSRTVYATISMMWSLTRMEILQNTSHVILGQLGNPSEIRQITFYIGHHFDLSQNLRSLVTHQSYLQLKVTSEFETVSY